MRRHPLRQGPARPLVRMLLPVPGLFAVLGLAHLAFGAPAHRDPAPAAPKATAASASQGEWSAVVAFNPPVVAIHASLLPDGKVLMWERYPAQPEPQWTNTYIWDPAHLPSGKLKTIKNTFANVFCAGETLEADGTLLVAGGHDRYDGFGTKTLLFFDYRTETWRRGPDMNRGRWYPTTAPLANGEVLVISGEARGDVEAPSMNILPQVWTGHVFRDLTDAQKLMGTYPWMLPAPNGKVFWAGPQQQTWYLDTAGRGRWEDGPERGNDLDRGYGSAVMYEPGKVLVVGGGETPPTATAKTIDLNAGSPTWQPTEPMKYARRQLNATLLPDGKVLVTGGTSSPGFNNGAASVRAAEMWDPGTGKWTQLAAMSAQVKRLYHSTALLLRDGRVLSAGGGLPPADDDDGHKYPNFQVFSPPYLFAGPRPVITTAPKTLTYGASFTVKTPDAARVHKVTLVRLGSVTHAFDQSQRFVKLPATQAEGGVTATAPKGPKIVSPGPYLLFILDDAGVPSVAEIVELRG